MIEVEFGAFIGECGGKAAIEVTERVELALVGGASFVFFAVFFAFGAAKGSTCDGLDQVGVDGDNTPKLEAIEEHRELGLSAKHLFDARFESGFDLAELVFKREQEMGEFEGGASEVFGAQGITGVGRHL